MFTFSCCSIKAVEGQVVQDKTPSTKPTRANSASTLKTSASVDSPKIEKSSSKQTSQKVIPPKSVEKAIPSKPVEKALPPKPVVKALPPKPVPKIPDSEGDLQVIQKINSALPGAYTNASIASAATTVLKTYGYGETTLLATSLCSDEVNRELENEFIAAYGDNFSMGGLAGFPFGGVTGFVAMASHIPSDGSCLIVYGPHVGIDSEGNVGKVNRRGRKEAGSCCGSAAAAAGYVKNVRAKIIDEATIPDDLIDLQQAWVGEALLPHGDRLEEAADPEVELPLALFDCQHEMMKEIVAAGCNVATVPVNGKVALLGGIQINTPEGTSDCFLPKVFQLWNEKGEMEKDLLTML